jgi:hypothetical protein
VTLAIYLFIPEFYGKALIYQNEAR